MKRLDLIEIQWDDASALEHGWTDPTDEKPVAQIVTTVGFLVAETDDHLVVAHTTDRTYVNGRFQIPKAMVKKIKHLRKQRVTKPKSDQSLQAV